MARFIVRLRSDADLSTQIASQQIQALPGVTDAVPARTTNAVTVVVPDDQAEAMRDELAGLDFVDAVFDDIQGVPQVANEELREEFFRTVREARGTEEPPSTMETEPRRRSDADDLRSDGGTTIPDLSPGERAAEGEVGPIDDADASVAFANALDLHDQGITGQSVIAVNLDTGVCEHQFAASRRLAGADLTGNDDPYADPPGHGSYTMGLFAGGAETGGIEHGFVPGADIFPIRSTLAGSELIQAQDIIVDLAESTGRPVIVNNSIGFEQCTGLCDHPVTDAVQTAASHPRVIQVWAAGNQAGDCGQGCSDTGISGPNSLDNVITVGATGHDGQPDDLHGYSSRGGSDASCGTNKPDVTAPIFGWVPWACDRINVENGGGTSGACPQVAGTVALMVDAIGEMRSVKAAVAAIEQTARQFQGSGWNGCTGHGNVDTAAAADAFGDIVPRSARGSLGVVAAGALSGLAPVALDEVRRS